MDPSSNPSNIKQYRAFSLNPPRKRSSVLQSQSPDELARNYILSKMNHKIRNLSNDNPQTNPSQSIVDVLNSHDKDINKRRNSNLLMKKKDDVQRRKNLAVFSKLDQQNTDFSLNQRHSPEFDIINNNLHPNSNFIPNSNANSNSNDNQIAQKEKENDKSLFKNDISSDLKSRASISNVPTISTQSDPLMTSLISRLKQTEEKLKTLETNMKSKDTELKRVKKLGREHKSEAKALHQRMGELLSLIANMSEYIDNENPSHPFKTQIRSVKLFSQQFYDENFKMSQSKDLNLDMEQKPIQDEFDTQEIQQSNDTKTVNIPLLKQRIEALNSTIVEDFEIVQANGMSKFKEKKTVNIIFYSNGLIVDNGSFRPYEWDITKAFLVDILDGYFPFEFKETYPNGVRINLVDKSTEKYTRSNAAQKEIISGNLHNLDNLKDIKNEVPKNKKEFLDKLPKQVVKDGIVINVRQNIASMLGDSIKENALQPGQKELTCNTECYEQVSKSKNNNEQPPRHALIRLKLPKIENISLETILIYLFPHQTIAELRNQIDNQININKQIQYSLRCWPNIRLEDTSKTVEESGLVPNVSMFLHIL